MLNNIAYDLYIWEENSTHPFSPNKSWYTCLNRLSHMLMFSNLDLLPCNQSHTMMLHAAMVLPIILDVVHISSFYHIKFSLWWFKLGFWRTIVHSDCGRLINLELVQKVSILLWFMSFWTLTKHRLFKSACSLSSFNFCH